MALEQDKVIPDWIKNLQENSWELELLISGGAIFSLFQLSDLFLDSVGSLQFTSSLAGEDFFIIIISGMLGIKLLTVGFIAHLLLRAYWLGLVCINYVYPQGIAPRSKSLRYPFTTHYIPGDNLYNQIMAVDKYSGLAMFLSIISTLVILGFIISILLVVTLPLRLLTPSAGFWFAKLVTVIYVLYFADLFLFGFFRKTKGLSLLLYPFYRFFDFITLRVLYRKALIIYSSNIRKWKFTLVFLLFLMLAALFTYSAVYKIMHWPNMLDSRNYRFVLTDFDKQVRTAYYMDNVQAADKPFRGPAIQSQIITGNFLKLYLPYYKQYDELFENVNNNKFKTPAELVLVEIDGVEVSNVDWYNYRGFANDELGLYTIIDIKGLDRGKHILRLAGKISSSYSETIPFWKESSKIE